MKQVQLDKIREQFEASETLYKRIKAQLEFETKKLDELLSKQKGYDDEYSTSKPEYEKISSLLGSISSKLEELEKNRQATSQIIGEQKMRIIDIEEKLADAKSKMDADAAMYQAELNKADGNGETPEEPEKPIVIAPVETKEADEFVDKLGETFVEITQEISESLKKAHDDSVPSDE